MRCRFGDSHRARGAHVNLCAYLFSLVFDVLGFGSGSILMLAWRFRIFNWIFNWSIFNWSSIFNWNSVLLAHSMMIATSQQKPPQNTIFSDPHGCVGHSPEKAAPHLCVVAGGREDPVSSYLNRVISGLLWVSSLTSVTILPAKSRKSCINMERVMLLVYC